MRWLILAFVLLIACAPLPIDDTIVLSPVPTPDKPQEIQVNRVLNGNPGLALGGCSTHHFDDGFWGMVNVKQCHPKGYTLYQLWQTQNGDTDNHLEFISTNPMAVTYNGESYTVYPFGRAGDIGFVSLPIALIPRCYKAEIRGFNHLTYTETFKAGLTIQIGSNRRESKTIIGKGAYSYSWFFSIETMKSVPITFYATFPYGDIVNGESYLTFTDFEVSEVSIGHCQ